jgi:hypothetical protein
MAPIAAALLNGYLPPESGWLAGIMKVRPVLSWV